MGAVGINYKFRQKDLSDNQVTLNALNEAQNDYETRMKDVDPDYEVIEDSFEGPGGLEQEDWDQMEARFYSKIKGVPVRVRNGVRQYLMPLEEGDPSEIAEKVSMSDEWWSFKEIMKTNISEEGEVGLFAEALGDGIEDRAVKAEEGMVGGVAGTTAVAMAPWLTLHHDSKNFIDKETKTHIGKERGGVDKWKDMATKVGEGGVAYGVYRGVKSEASNRALKYTGIDKLPKYVRSSAERLKNKITQGIRDYMNSFSRRGAEDMAFEITEDVGLATFL